MSQVQFLSRYGLPVLLVCAVHGALLAGLRVAAPGPAALPETMEVMILAEAMPPAAPSAATPLETPPLAQRPGPVLPMADPVPAPISAGPTLADAALARPEPAPATSAPAAPAQAEAVPALPEPVLVPPRIDASYRGNPKPSYPLAARFNEKGTVHLSLFVKADGTVGEVKLVESSGYRSLDKAAMDTVKHWKLIPARRGSEPIAMWYPLPIHFKLEN